MSEKEKKAFQLTPDQENAITARGVDLAVSAAAGSGKTAVLTRRIVGLLAEKDSGVDAGRIAVVTYTKAAAAELEEKLYRVLSEEAEKKSDPHLLRQLARLQQAQISTIHSLAFSIIRENRMELGLEKGVRIADDAQCATLRKKAVEQALAEYLSREGAPDLVGLFGSGNSKYGLVRSVTELMTATDSLERGISGLLEQNEENKSCYAKMQEGTLSFWQSPWGQILYEEIREKLSFAQEILSQSLVALSGTVKLTEVFCPTLQEMYFGVQKALAATLKGDPDAGKASLLPLLNLPLDTARGLPAEEKYTNSYCRECFKKAKDLVGKVWEILVFSPEERLADLGESLFLAEHILSLVQGASENYTKMKREASVLDYADLEHMALSLLAEYKDGEWVKTPLADRISAEYDALFVDEYQDSNSVQDRLFRCLAQPGRLFIVGDPKQSIYRFRGAEPSIFSGYKNNLKHYKKGQSGMQKILLSANFRCDATVIELVNRIFSRMMHSDKEDSLYKEEDFLKHEKETPEGYVPEPAELVLVGKPAKKKRDDAAEEGEEAEGGEAEYIANRIGHLLAEKEPDGTPRYKPKDIAVLFCYSTGLEDVKKALEKRGIPCTAGPTDLWKEDGEYLFLTSLLKTMDNPCRDVPFLGTLSSPVFRFDSDMLYRIRRLQKKTSFYSAFVRYAREKEDETALRCREVLSTLAELQSLSKDLSLSEFVFHLYTRWSLEALFARKGRQNRVIKNFALASAASLETGEFATAGALSRRMEETSIEEFYKNQKPGGDGVQLVTIHGSKGLEYRVVFVSFLSQTFVCQDEYKTMLFTPKLGPCTSVMRLGGKAKISPACKRALRQQLHRDMIEEEMRVFYVALTRAKEKLILTASVKDRAALSLALFRHPTAVEKRIRDSLTLLATSPRGLILPCLGDDPALGRVLDGEDKATENGFTVRFVTDLPPEPVLYSAPDNREAVSGDPEAVLQELSFVYDHKDEVVLPNKLSVSQLLSRSEEEEWGELYPTHLVDFDRGVLRTGAEKIGTATHQVMQFCDFAAMAKDPEGEMERLVTRGFLSAEDLQLVNTDQVTAFFRSELYKKLLASPSVEREKRFNVLLPGSALGVGEGEVLVQGVVDAWFENPDGTLTILDFKTDRVKSENGEAVLRERHGHQLRLYALAVETMTGKKVSSLVLYSFALQREVPVERGSGAKDS